MKFTKLNFLALLAASTLAVQAAPLPKSSIPSDVNWFLHADIDQFKSTQLGTFILEQTAKPDNQEKIDGFKTFTGIDITKNLHGLTICGPGTKGEDGVLMIWADFDPARIENLAKMAKDYEEVKHGSHTIHSWIDESKKQRSYGAVAKGVVIIGQRSATVGSILDVIDGTKPSFKGTVESFSNLSVSETAAVVLGAVRQATVPQENPGLAWLKNVGSMAFYAGEKGGDIQAQLKLGATNEETAKQIVSVVQGFSALLNLQKDKPEAQKFAQSVAPVLDGKTVSLSLKLPVSETIQMLKDAEAKKKK